MNVSKVFILETEFLNFNELNNGVKKYNGLLKQFFFRVIKIHALYFIPHRESTNA